MWAIIAREDDVTVYVKLFHTESDARKYFEDIRSIAIDMETYWSDESDKHWIITDDYNFEIFEAEFGNMEDIING